MDIDKKYERYTRQIILSGFGMEAQRKMLASSVLVVGAGGLGCPALQYLASAGVGTIGIVDSDIIQLSNLHRQILYKDSDIGLNKARLAAERVKEINPQIQTRIFDLRLHNQNAFSIIEQFDLVIDGTDN